MEQDKVYLDFIAPQHESPCMICGELVSVRYGEIALIICDKCKEAVLRMRKQIEIEKN